ncbi:zinc-dependent metalloprotease [Bdellovibrio sp. KM01]|uniref:zinc-dependent metalloprotease n=1 Tax=Bdellovibrio sp. KM01 TaxID=2748865 RepID=UPI0015EA15D4|nr:zinc-dependent metalloprotease [Bdellovibrio sp. KM01]QLY26468.1 zinc-dependent metalloprotease [Bdellovibrio sp. KM01]
MQFFNRTSVAVLLCSSLLMACTKETVRVEEKLLPPAKIEATATIQKNTISFAKSSLGKLFMLMPIQTKASRAAAPEYLRSLLVSFERNGSRIAVYNRSTDNSQSDIVVDALIQTFEVVSETEDNVTFDIGQGFMSLNMQPGLDVVILETYPIQSQVIETKSENVLKLKDSFVKSLALKNNAIQLVQDVRVTRPFKPYVEIDPKIQKDLEEIGGIPTEVEQGATLAIEIKPYVSNENFVVRKYDSEQRFGFFINKVGKGSTETKEPLGQIARWDIAESRGPIRMLVAPNFPAHLREGVTHSANYWNKIFGREVLKVEFDSIIDAIQPDRTIVVRWIQWDEGNGAYANIQTDPLTGESLRAMVYITSAFTADKNYVEGRPKSGEVMGSSLRGLCDLEIDGSSIHKVNIVGEVMTHEVGHVLGLRHNFAGTANAPVSDQEIKEAVDKIIADGTVQPVAASSTVMDYPPTEVYSILGAYTKSNSLPYDKAAIEWGYYGKETPRIANMYCSDEHIMSVGLAERRFLGCERRDLYANVFFAEREKVLSAAKNIVANTVSALKYSFASLKVDDFKAAQYYFSFSPSLRIVSDLYEATPQKTQPLVIVDDVVPDYLSNLSPYATRKVGFYNSYDAPGDKKITSDLAVFGGMKAYLETLNPIKVFGEGFFQNQVKDPKTVKLLIAAGLTEEQALRVQAGWMIRAKSLDEKEAAEVVSKLVDLNKLRRPEWQK